MDFPIKNGDFPIVMLVYQRVSWNMLFGNFQKSIERLDMSRRLEIISVNHAAIKIILETHFYLFGTPNSLQLTTILKGWTLVVAEKICETQLLKKPEFWIANSQRLLWTNTPAGCTI